MADVRLTATNPEDSSVVPVACDAAGRLLLEEPQVIEGPPGPPGEQGPPGQDGQDGQDGDPFSGNFADDVTFGGSATFAGNVQVGGDPNLGTASGSKMYSSGGFWTCREFGESPGLAIWKQGDNTPNCEIFADGSADFAGNIVSGNITFEGNGVNLNRNGSVYIQQSNANENALAIIHNNYTQPHVSIKADGSCTFAGNKAGFTAEGYLWCTTERGDTVMLQATVGGAGLWVDYTPTTRREEIRDKLDAIRGDTGEMPADTQ